MKAILAKILNFIGNRVKGFKKINFKIRDILVFSIIKNIFDKIENEYKPEITGNVGTQKIIWVYWAQGINEAPILVKKCVDILRTKIQNYDVIVIDNNNIKEYVDIPAYIYAKVKNKKITLTHFSDILRVNLISKYGGIWIDSTVFISDEFNNLIQSEKNIITIPQKDIHYSISCGKWSAWLIGTKNRTEYFEKMKMFFDIYWKKYNILPCYFLIDYLLEYMYRNDKTFRKDIDDVLKVDFSVYEMIEKLNEKCTEEEFGLFLQEHYVNKLSYKLDYSLNQENTYSYYIFNK